MKKIERTSRTVKFIPSNWKRLHIRSVQLGMNSTSDFIEVLGQAFDAEMDRLYKKIKFNHDPIVDSQLANLILTKWNEGWDDKTYDEELRNLTETMDDNELSWDAEA